MNTKQALAKVQPERVYSLTEIVRAGFLPVKSYPTAYRIVLEDKAKAEATRTLDAAIIGEGRARTIRITGKNLIAYLRSIAK